MTKVTIVGNSVKVVEVPGVICIEEIVGGVSTKDDGISVACVSTGAGTEEPWLTMQYAEWLHIKKGQCIAKTDKDSSEGDVIIEAGQTAFIEKGSTWKPTFPVATEYIAICLPAFRPDRCVREGENNEEGMELLKGMHTSSVPPPPPSSDMIYHMTTKAMWDECVAKDEAYYPLTFEVDGFYTHATSVAPRLLTTANHFYQDIEGEWICLEVSRKGLKKCGIVIKDEEPLPVGDKAIGDDWMSWVCPHIYGGIPPVCVHKVNKMYRDGKLFTGIENHTF
jgi:uncharacterized protein (DUF952 family)